MTGSTLKFLMSFLMVLDHIHYFVPIELQAFFHLISRPVAAVFTFLSVEGFIHTRNRKKYIIRLFTAGIIMYIGNFIINHLIIINPAFHIKNSIFLSLGLSVTALYFLEELYYKEKNILGLIFIFGLMILGIFTEGGIMVIPLSIIIYIYRDNIKKRDLILIIMSLSLLPNLFLSGFTNLKEFLINFGEMSDILFFVAGIPFFHIYNGKRGLNNKFSKYFFYVFYPLHLWIIGIVASLLK